MSSTFFMVSKAVTISYRKKIIFYYKNGYGGFNRLYIELIELLTEFNR